jgi:hypothetical protein
MPTALESAPTTRLTTAAAPQRVDRGRNMIRGMVVAMHGDFKTPGRGTFNGDSLSRIVMLGNASSKGLRSRFTHPDLCHDGLGTFLGRVTNFYHAVATRYDGEKVPAVRADLSFDRTALVEPPRGGGRPLGLYVMDLAESDPDALSSSLVLSAHKIEQLDPQGKKKVDEKGDPLPPIWLPKRLTASDVVDTGDAVDGILTADPFAALTALLDAPASRSLPNDIVGTASAVLDRLFTGRDRDDVADRIEAFKRAYLARKFGG